MFACFGHPGKTTGIPIHVFGTETHMTAIVGMALGHRPIPNQPPMDAHTANFLLNASSNTVVLSLQTHQIVHFVFTSQMTRAATKDFFCR